MGFGRVLVWCRFNCLLLVAAIIIGRVLVWCRFNCLLLVAAIIIVPNGPPPSGTPTPVVSTGVPEREGRCGAISQITCSASVVENLATTPAFMWVGPAGVVVDPDNVYNIPNADTLANGVYMCMTCVDVESVGINDLCGNASVTIQNMGEFYFMCTNEQCCRLCVMYII